MFKELNILSLFFNDPEREFNVREVARILKISPATASTKLSYFHHQKVLKYRLERNIDLYGANIEEQKYRDLKQYYTITKIRESGFIEYLNKTYLLPTVILFGSAATGYDILKSDIDVVVITEKSDVHDSFLKYERILHKKIQLFVVKNLADLKNDYLINNVLNGIVLQGEIQWI